MAIEVAGQLPPASGAFVPHDLKKPLAPTGSGLLDGLSIAIKDMYDIAGEQTGGGSPFWLRRQRPAMANAAIVDHLLAAGATISGKVVCDELMYSLSGQNHHYGTPVNPRAPLRVPGGSSSGSAVAVASGACDIAIGSDTGGSVRIPAAFNGVYGIRPTHGRVDLAGAMAMAPSFDVPGWFAAGSGLLRQTGRVLLIGESRPHRVEQVVLLEDTFDQTDPAIVAALEGFIAGAGIVPARSHRASFSSGGLDEWRQCFRSIQAHEFWQTFGEWIADEQPEFGPDIRERVDYAATVNAADMAQACSAMKRIRESVHDLLQPGTVALMPTAPCLPPLLDARPDELDQFRSRTMNLTCIAGLGGLPQLSIPATSVSGCPVGLSLLGWSGGDEALLDMASALAPRCGGAF